MTSTYGLHVPSDEGIFALKAQVMSEPDIERALKRIAYEVIERNKGSQGLVVVGLATGGVKVAEKLCGTLGEISSPKPDFGQLGIAPYRDDVHLRPIPIEEVTSIQVDIDSRTVLLVDDVISTGRTVRAALAALNDFGRPTSVQLAVLIDRGHRELPIKPDYVGKNLPTSREEYVEVTDAGVAILEKVLA